MASSEPVPCGPCREEKVNTKADIWCNNCDEGLCSTCSSHHKRIKSSRDHKTIDIENYTSHKPLSGLFKAECDAHSQQFNLYCPSHLTPCCDECISTSHSKCTGITSLASVVEKTKIEKSQESVEKDINSISHFLDKLINNKSGNLKRGEQQYESIKQSVSKIRNKINIKLDRLEEKLCKEADTVWGREKSKLTSLITEIEDKTKQLKEMQDDLKTVTNHTSKLQSFLGVHLIEQKVHLFQRYVEDIEDSESDCDIDIKIKQNDETDKILKELQSIISFGDVTVIKIEKSLKKKTSVSMEAQIQLQEQSNIQNMTMNIETRIQIDTMKKISDMICLMDGRFIIVELDGNVNLLTSDGTLEKQLLAIPGEAWSVTQINKNTIAITYPGEGAIKIFNIKTETVTKIITFDRACWGLSYSSDSLIVGLGTDEIRIIDLEGNTLKLMQVGSKSFLTRLVYCNERVIYTDNVGKAVYCVDESGKQIWQYKQYLLRPMGLCTDMYGNIIVADSDSGSIIVVSKDGLDSKILNRTDDIEYKPSFMCFNKRNDSFGFIYEGHGNNITRFNMSYE